MCLSVRKFENVTKFLSWHLLMGVDRNVSFIASITSNRGLPLRGDVQCENLKNTLSIQSTLKVDSVVGDP